MCGRYTLTHPGQLLADLGVEAKDEAVRSRYNIAPTQNAAVVRADPEGGRELAELHWGLIPSWAKEPAIGNRMINARSESAPEKPAFRAAFRRRRCVVLTDGFYEWQKTPGGKQPFHIHLPERQPFVFAGLWERWRRDEKRIESFTILTTRANDDVAEVHDRMPVILPPDAWDTWLDRSLEDPDPLRELLVPYAPGELLLTPVSRRVNNPKNDDPACLDEIRRMPDDASDDPQKKLF